MNVYISRAFVAWPLVSWSLLSVTMSRFVTKKTYPSLFILTFICHQDAIQLSLGSFYPNLLLSGIIWPLEGMPDYLRWSVSRVINDFLTCYFQVHFLCAPPDIRVSGSEGDHEPGLGPGVAPGLQGLPGHPGLDHRPPGRQHHRPQDQEVVDRGGGGGVVSGIHSVFQVSVVHPFHVGASKRSLLFMSAKLSISCLHWFLYLNIVILSRIILFMVFPCSSCFHPSIHQKLSYTICQIFIMIKSMDI